MGYTPTRLPFILCHWLMTTFSMSLTFFIVKNVCQDAMCSTVYDVNSETPSLPSPPSPPRNCIACKYSHLQYLQSLFFFLVHLTISSCIHLFHISYCHFLTSSAFLQLHLNAGKDNNSWTFQNISALWALPPSKQAPFMVLWPFFSGEVSCGWEDTHSSAGQG